MDLAGPKLRTGPLRNSPGILRLKTPKDGRGKHIGPARVWISSVDSLPPEKAHHLPVIAPSEWLEELKAGQKIRFRDTRGKKRILELGSRVGGAHGCWGESKSGAYLQAGTKLTLEGSKKGGKKGGASVAELPPREDPILLRTGDTLLLVRGNEVGRPAKRAPSGKVLKPAQVSCQLLQVFDNVKVR